MLDLLTPLVIADPWFYVVAIPAVIIVGLSKGGFGGIAAISTPMVALVVSPVQAAAILLPILIVMDATALIAYRKIYDPTTLRIMLPAAVLGIGVGWLIAASIDPDAVRLIIGAIAVAFTLDHWFGRRHTEPAAQSIPKGTFWGALTGFTSFVAHAGAPPYQVYVMPLGLAPRVFAGTAVVFYSVVNAIKLIPYFFLGQFSAENLVTSAVLMPLAPVATLCGVWLVRVIDPSIFYRILYVSLFLLGIKLLWDGAAAFAAAYL